jgi:hypothetical protein
VIPFPGESLRIYGADAGGVDGTLFNDIQIRGGGRLITDGDEWKAWVNGPDVIYLEAPDPDVVVSWVVEVTSGTATLAIGEGADPSFSDYGVATSPLGTFTVTGPTQLVVPSGFTSSDLFDGSFALVTSIECTDGSAVIEQVKLRAWPSAGPLGGWSEFPAFDHDPVLPQVWTGQENATTNGSEDNEEDSWDEAAQLMVGQAQSVPVAFDPGNTSGGFANTPFSFTQAQQVVTGVTPRVVSTSMQLQSTGAVLVGRDWQDAPAVSPTLVDGVDIITPPDEVPGDSARYVQQLGDGSHSWVNDGIIFRIGSEQEPLASMVYRLETAPFLDLADPSFSLPAFSIGPPIPLDTPPSNEQVIHDASVGTADRYVAVTLTHRVGTGGESGTAADWPGTGATALGGPVIGGGAEAYFGLAGPDDTVIPMMTVAHMPAYLGWAVTVVAARVPPLRQRNRDTIRARLRASRQRSIRARGYL